MIFPGAIASGLGLPRSTRRWYRTGRPVTGRARAQILGQEPHGPHARRKLRQPASGSPSRGRCQLRRRGPVRMQHEGFRRRRRSPAPRLRTPPHCHVRRRIARGARTSWPIGSRRAPASEGGSHSRPEESVGESRQSQVEREKVLRREPMRGWGRVRARASRPILGQGEGGLRSCSESRAGAGVDIQSELGGGEPQSSWPIGRGRTRTRGRQPGL